MRRAFEARLAKRQVAAQHGEAGLRKSAGHRHQQGRAAITARAMGEHQPGTSAGSAVQKPLDALALERLARGGAAGRRGWGPRGQRAFLALAGAALVALLVLEAALGLGAGAASASASAPALASPCFEALAPLAPAAAMLFFSASMMLMTLPGWLGSSTGSGGRPACFCRTMATTASS